MLLLDFASTLVTRDLFLLEGNLKPFPSISSKTHVEGKNTWPFFERLKGRMLFDNLSLNLSGRGALKRKTNFPPRLLKFRRWFLTVFWFMFTPNRGEILPNLMFTHLNLGKSLVVPYTIPFAPLNLVGFQT